jgi:starch synthase (maltosyl-transferring)
MAAAVEQPAGPRIYNLFPLLAGPLPRWRAHLERARAMGFDWIFINPIQLSGYSESLYSIKDYYAIDSRLLDPGGGPPQDQVAEMVKCARELGLNLMIDLVINHTAFDSVLVKEHPAWYKRDRAGAMVNPGVTTGDDQKTWGDLFEIDNEGSPDRDNLWNYWRQVIADLYAQGFRGLRCDAAYKVPADLWRFLIGAAKSAHPDTLFFAETLGCPFDEALEVAHTGFDFLFNSSKWWDFTEPWCLKQYGEVAKICRSVSFPESHDTERLAEELEGDQRAVKMRYAFSALFCSGVMMPIGFEYGFRRRLDVVKTRPEDWEEPAFDLTGYIGRVNELKRSRRVFNEEGPIDRPELGNPQVVALVKQSLDRRERALILLNRDRRRAQTFNLGQVHFFATGSAQVEDISPERRLEHSSDFTTGTLEPSAVNVLYARQ